MYAQGEADTCARSQKPSTPTLGYGSRRGIPSTSFLRSHCNAWLTIPRLVHGAQSLLGCLGVGGD